MTEPSEISSSSNPLDNPFDPRHFITRIIEISGKELNEKELEWLSRWIDPDINMEEKQRLLNTLPENTIQRILLLILKSGTGADIQKLLLRSVWENNLDMTAMKNDILHLCTSEDEEVAMEACTVLKTNVRFANDKEKEELLVRYQEKDFSRPYLYEIFRFSLENK